MVHKMLECAHTALVPQIRFADEWPHMGAEWWNLGKRFAVDALLGEEPSLWVPVALLLGYMPMQVHHHRDCPLVRFGVWPRFIPEVRYDKSPLADVVWRGGGGVSWEALHQGMGGEEERILDRQG